LEFVYRSQYKSTTHHKMMKLMNLNMNRIRIIKLTAIITMMMMTTIVRADDYYKNRIPTTTIIASNNMAFIASSSSVLSSSILRNKNSNNKHNPIPLIKSSSSSSSNTIRLNNSKIKMSITFIDENDDSSSNNEHDTNSNNSNQKNIRLAPTPKTWESSRTTNTTSTTMSKMSILTHPPSECNPDELHANTLAYIGDGVYELFIRNLYIWPRKRMMDTQLLVVGVVRAETQSKLLQRLLNSPHIFPLTSYEKSVVRRGRNAVSKSNASKKNSLPIRQDSTAFEALIGYVYLKDENRCSDILEYLKMELGYMGLLSEKDMGEDDE